MKTIQKMPCTFMQRMNRNDMNRNDTVLKDLPGKFYTIEASDKIPDNYKYLLALIQAAQNQKQTHRKVSKVA